MAGKRYLERSIFANTVSQKSHFVIFETDFTESVLRAKTSKLRRLYIGILDGNAEQL